MATAAKCQLDTSYFFEQLASAEKRFLILDFDSTLARIGATSELHFPHPVVTDLLECIAACSSTRLILASTGSTSELADIMPCPDLEIWGSDGLERIAPSARGHKIHRVPLRVQTQAVANRRTLINQRSSRHPLAYLVGTGPREDSEFFVVPELHLGKTQVLTAKPEPLVQFLAEWLRVCAGEVC